MLTADLLRARVVGGEVRPAWVPLEGPPATPYLERAAELIALYTAHVGRERGPLDAELEARIAGHPEFKLDRGLVKLLEDRSRWSGLCPDEAAARRQAVFQAAAAARRAGDYARQAVLEGVAGALRLEPALLERELWGDLPEQERLLEFAAPAPLELLQRYNLALAQAVLLRAARLEVEVQGADPPRLRALLREARFQGLLQEARREGETVRLSMDGPLSLFQATPRYGVRMAGFLPALLHCERWTLRAEVQLGRARRTRRFQLDPGAGLTTTRRDAGAWLPELIEAFEGRFREVAPGWEVDRDVPLLQLGGEVLVPDFRFVHRQSGWEGWLEVLGYWRKGGVARRLAALTAHDAPRLVLALEHGLKVDDEALDELKSGPVVPFREVPDARKVRDALERLRRAAPTPPAAGAPRAPASRGRKAAAARRPRP